MDLEQLTRRLVMAEQEIAQTHAEIAVVRQQCKRLGRTRTLVSVALLVGGVGMAGIISSATTQAQGGLQRLTVRAPFTVVDSANKPIMSVGEGHRGITLVRSDGQSFVGLYDEASILRAPLHVTDNAQKAIMTVQDSTTTQQKDATGKEKEVTSNRGIHVFNGKGDAVARVAVSEDSGYVSARQAGQGTGNGGIQAALAATKDLTAVWLVNNAKKRSVALESDADGLQFFDDANTVRAQITTSKLWLGNKGGEGVVEAGTLPDGRGVVRTGPRNGGPLGPGTLNIPFAIMGHK